MGRRLHIDEFVELRALRRLKRRPGAVVIVRVHVRGWRAFGDMMDALVLLARATIPPHLSQKAAGQVRGFDQLLRVRASGLRCRPRRLCAAPRRLGAGTALRLRLCAMMLVQPILDP
jgi:hypothetical protein